MFQIDELIASRSRVWPGTLPTETVKYPIART